VIGLSIALTVAGCGGPTAETEDLWDVSQKLTYRSVAAVGPHHTEATATHERGGERPRSRTEVLDIRWGDWDNFQVRRSRDGQLTSETRVIQGVAMTRTGRAGFKQARDAELYRVELGQTWNSFGLALAPFQWRLAASFREEVVVEGRPAHRYRLHLEELAEGETQKGNVPTALSGYVVLDGATGVRLLAEVEGTWLEQGREDRIWTTRYRLTRSGFGVPPDLLRPRDLR